MTHCSNALSDPVRINPCASTSALTFARAAPAWATVAGWYGLPDATVANSNWANVIPEFEVAGSLLLISTGPEGSVTPRSAHDLPGSRYSSSSFLRMTMKYALSRTSTIPALRSPSAASLLAYSTSGDCNTDAAW